MSGFESGPQQQHPQLLVEDDETQQLRAAQEAWESDADQTWEMQAALSHVLGEYRGAGAAAVFVTRGVDLASLMWLSREDREKLRIAAKMSADEFSRLMHLQELQARKMVKKQVSKDLRALPGVFCGFGAISLFAGKAPTTAKATIAKLTAKVTADAAAEAAEAAASEATEDPSRPTSRPSQATAQPVSSAEHMDSPAGVQSLGALEVDAASLKQILGTASEAGVDQSAAELAAAELAAELAVKELQAAELKLMSLKAQRREAEKTLWREAVAGKMLSSLPPEADAGTKISPGDLARSHQASTLQNDGGRNKHAAKDRDITKILTLAK